MKALLILENERTIEIIRTLLITQRQIKIIKLCSTRDEVFEACKEAVPDVIFCQLIGSRSFAILNPVQESYPNTRIIGVTTTFDEYKSQMIKIMGIQGYITTIMDEAVKLEIFNKVMQGEIAIPENRISCKEKIG